MLQEFKKFLVELLDSEIFFIIVIFGVLGIIMTSTYSVVIIIINILRLYLPDNQVNYVIMVTFLNRVAVNFLFDSEEE
jgi:hypothetical protein